MSLKRAEVGTPGVVAGELKHAFVFYSLTPGRCGYGPNLDELCGALRSAHSPLAERRQALVDFMLHGCHVSRFDATRIAQRATRVRLTNEIVAAAWGVRQARDMARAVLEAAGFEVIE